MTNPPFYDPDSMEISAARAGDNRSRTNMTVSEGNYPNGEVGFVCEMIEDSLRAQPGTPAKWFSSMLGKKTSLVKLQKLLVHIFGPGHVEATEYGPGQYTRWFLAWTLDQPVGTASNAVFPSHDQDKFQLTMSSLVEQGSSDKRIQNIDDAMTEVVNRVVAFCDSSPGGWDLMANVTNQPNGIVNVRIQESMPLAINNYVDETQDNIDIPEAILQALESRDDNSLFLPEEGHFVTEVRIQAAVDHTTINIQLFSFRHSARGTKVIEKVRSSLEGEVCRTNRKWRKIRERQQGQQQQC
jgi:hypothetical protein